MIKVMHRYRNTCGVSKMSNMGMGMLLNFNTLQHTVYPYCGIVGVAQVNYNKVSFAIFNFYCHILSYFIRYLSECAYVAVTVTL